MDGWPRAAIAGETARRDVPLVRIFLSSPGDVAEERSLARQLIDTVLPKLPYLRERVHLQLIAWDDPAAQIPMLATETPQASVNAARPRPATCDIVIVVLWSRMGTPLPESVRKLTGEPYLSGTEWEYEDAVNSPQQPRPDVLIYRRTEEPKIGLRDPQKKEKEEQFERVDVFFEQFRNPDGSLKGGVNEYATPSDFRGLLGQHLDEILCRRLQPFAAIREAQSPVATIPSEYLAWLKRTCADVSLLGQDVQKSHSFTLNHVYVPALTRPRSKPLAQRTGRPERREGSIPLLQRLDQESLYVPAPAGAGKSTFCRWAVLKSIGDAGLSHRVSAPEEFTEPVPVALRGRLPLLVPLRDFATGMDCGRGERTWHRTDLEKAVTDWVDRSPPPGLTGALLAVHLNAGSAFLLLDGLDEVPVSQHRRDVTTYPRELLLSGLADALPVWQRAGNRILLTSRPYGLEEAGLHRLGLERAPLEPLPQPLQDLFVTRWFDTLGKKDVIPDLIATIHSREELVPLIENPMLLTALCVLYDSGGRLSEDRYELYKRIINNVLHSRYPGDAGQREPVLRRLEAIAYGMHTGEPGAAPRVTPAAEISWVETERILARFAELNPALEKGQVDSAVRREELLTRSGLLLPLPNERAAFYHLSFQEFLAAQRIVRIGNDLDSVFREHGPVAEWRSTLLFLFAAQVFNKDAEWGLALLNRLLAQENRAAVKAEPGLAVFIAEALELCLTKNYRVPSALAEVFRRLSREAIEDEIELQVRQAIGLRLGRLGDPRIPGLRDPSAYVEVAAGIYPYVEIEAPFRLGRYPVTNGQFQDFLEDKGYERQQWWSDPGWAWLQGEGVTEPAFWREQRWNGPNQPVVGVSFWEAEACSRWAGGRLPGEQEWEAAARGVRGSKFPWGNHGVAGICNTVEAGLGVTSPVGLFPSSRQPEHGIEDLAGNVWEWCAVCERFGRVYKGGAIMRGGCWNLTLDDARSDLRRSDKMALRNRYTGFRTVCSSTPSGR